MENLSRYWQLQVLTAGGQLRLKDFPIADSFLKNHFSDLISDSTLSERALQDALWNIAIGDSTESPIAQLCLRCWLSHQIVYTCTELAQRFGESYGFKSSDLWPLALDDDGNLSTTYQPFSMKTLAVYDPERCSLSTWTSRLVKTHPDINQFLLRQGLYRATPWAILNDTKVSQLPRFLPHVSRSELDIAEQLLSAYHQVYRMDRIEQGTSRGQRCLTPTDEQLERIDSSHPPNVVLAQLRDLAEELRQSRLLRRGVYSSTQPLDLLEEGFFPAVPALDDTEEIQAEFLARYRTYFIATLDKAIKVTVEAYFGHYQKHKPSQGKPFLEALELFHCQRQSMGEIAKQLGLTNQVKVTRLLHLKRFRAQVVTHWTQLLINKVREEALRHLASEELAAITNQLEQILGEEISIVMAEAASEAQIPKNRTANSVLAKRLCKLMPDLKHRLIDAQDNRTSVNTITRKSPPSTPATFQPSSPLPSRLYP